MLAAVQTFSVWSMKLQARNLRAVPQTVKEIAVTFDDLPLNGARIDLKRLQAMTDKLLLAINKYQIPVVGFVNESLLYVASETDVRIAILKAWLDGGVELGNHTFSHIGFQNASLAEYEDDFIRDDAVTRRLMKQRGRRCDFSAILFCKWAGRKRLRNRLRVLSARAATASRP